jgi:non-heme chloroperoxidase
MKKIFSLAAACCIALTNPSCAQFLDGVNPEHIPPPTSELTEAVIKTIDLPTNVTLEYTEQGNADGIPVIMLHGFTDSRHSYDMALVHLPPALRVYTITQRGHGNSSKPKSSYDPGDFADDIAAFMKQLKIKRAVIVGHSMGSTIAQCFAVKYPELVKALVAIASFVDYNKPAVSEFKAVIDQLKDPVDSIFVAEFQKSTIVQPVPETMLMKFIAESRKVPAYVWQGVAAGWTKSEFAGILKQFNRPSLIIWGDKDVFCPRADQELLQKAIKNSRLLVYEGTGHAVHWEEPERFAKDLVEFINNL